MFGCVIVVEQTEGGQQLHVGKKACLAGAKSAPSSSKGKRTGLRRSWKRFGKKARMKMARKSKVFRRFVSNGIGFGEIQ